MASTFSLKDVHFPSLTTMSAIRFLKHMIHVGHLNVSVRATVWLENFLSA